MAYDIESKFRKNSPLPCWKGYERVPGKAAGSKGSCRKSSPMKVRKTKAGANLKRWFKTWSQMSSNEKSKVVTAKNRVGMGKRRASSSNVA